MIYLNSDFYFLKLTGNRHGFTMMVWIIMVCRMGMHGVIKRVRTMILILYLFCHYELINSPEPSLRELFLLYYVPNLA